MVVRFPEQALPQVARTEGVAKIYAASSAHAYGYAHGSGSGLLMFSISSPASVVSCIADIVRTECEPLADEVRLLHPAEAEHEPALVRAVVSCFEGDPSRNDAMVREFD